MGGGACIDFGKFICLGVYADENNLWDILKKEHNAPNKTLPLGTVLTHRASGSEVNNVHVISNKKNKGKNINIFSHTLSEVQRIGSILYYQLKQGADCVRNIRHVHAYN